MKRLSLLLAMTKVGLALVFLIGAGVSNTAQAQSYKIKAGDSLQIEVLEDPSLSRSVLVLPDGQFSFPFVGEVRAAGRSVSAIKSELANGLAPNFAVAPTVHVSVGELAEVAPLTPAVEIPYGIFAMGEINNPGRLDVSPRESITLLQALAQAGGFTPFAATKRIQLRRPDPKTGQEKVYTFNFETGGGISGATKLIQGDVLVVPERKLFE